MAEISCILTDIEGTTTEISFVYDVLFPYFREHLFEWEDVESDEIQEILTATQRLITEELGSSSLDRKALFKQLLAWSLEDRKVTPLKALQGIIWKKGFETGVLKGHVYPDVAPALARWHSEGKTLAIFSSGSVSAQKQLFGYSIDGDLSPYFSAFFDTQTGMKRDPQTYVAIANSLSMLPANVLFLSDVVEELAAAKQAGMHTTQLVRPGTVAAWDSVASNFSQIP
ncbi:MAG: acireductone synthase [Crocinitomicaceae bacterium]|jgi:enolase-phosphatase E1